MFEIINIGILRVINYKMDIKEEEKSMFFPRHQNPEISLEANASRASLTFTDFEEAIAFDVDDPDFARLEAVRARGAARPQAAGGAGM
ncbi:Protein of unknown function [Gryllus bimaculatus]|nr:Protein of unknown function [Gryllus bimaculatus]